IPSGLGKIQGAFYISLLFLTFRVDVTANLSHQFHYLDFELDRPMVEAYDGLCTTMTAGWQEEKKKMERVDYLSPAGEIFWGA
ncbi:hypothetical protein DFP72DRAFT_925994, partial [Ephemerocybe angulata]